MGDAAPNIAGETRVQFNLLQQVLQPNSSEHALVILKVSRRVASKERWGRLDDATRPVDDHFRPPRTTRYMRATKSTSLGIGQNPINARSQG
jgi:hypothetical protein